MMQESPERPQSFQSINKIWEKKLEDSGFYDIEKKEKFIIGSRSMFKMTPEEREAQRKYFENCEKTLKFHKFETDQEKMIWKRHTAGHSITDAANSLGLSRAKVFRTLQKIKKEILEREEWAIPFTK